MFYCRKYLISLSLLIIGVCQLNSQIYLQLERFNNPQSKKFGIGDNLEFRLKEFPDTWRKLEIRDLKPEEQLILFEDKYYNVDEFSELRLRYPVVKSLGIKFMQFSVVWFTYGGVATIFDEDFTIGKNEIILGASFAVTGLVMSTLLNKFKVKLGKRKRLRVMDLRFKDDFGY